MKNPIKNNRIISDITFATRFLNFVKQTNVSDACSFDEKEAMMSYATKLLEYQIETVEDKEEKDYLNRVGVLTKYKKRRIKTEDGVEILENNGSTLYSCLKKYQKGDEILTIRFKNLDQIKGSRYYFSSLENCKHFKNNRNEKI